MKEKKFPPSFERLAISLFGKEIPSPLIVGSGTLIETHEDIEPFLLSGVGGIVPRTTRKILERPSHPVPHLYQAGSKKFPIMINAEWTGADIHYWRPYLERMAANNRTIMSISGRDIAGCLAVCKELDLFQGWLYFEINISCAHSNHEHGMITRDMLHIKEVVFSLKQAGLRTPIALKLGHSDYILDLANVAKEAGVDAIVAINTYGPVFDFSINERGEPEPIVGIRGGKGGLSGAPIFQIALTDIAEIKRQIDITVIGCGGVVTAENVVKMLMAGASAVQVYTAAHMEGINAPAYFTKTNEKILHYMDTHNINNIRILEGKALPILEQKTELQLKVPVVNEKNCIGCDLCIPICLPKAITIRPSDGANKYNHVVEINADICIGCGHCIPVCPTSPKSLTLSQDFVWNAEEIGVLNT